jgi:hypothetical protein
MTSPEALNSKLENGNSEPESKHNNTEQQAHYIRLGETRLEPITITFGATVLSDTLSVWPKSLGSIHPVEVRR